MVQKPNPKGTHGKVSFSPDLARSPVSSGNILHMYEEIHVSLFLLKKKGSIPNIFSEPEFFENSIRFPTLTIYSQAKD